MAFFVNGTEYDRLPKPIFDPQAAEWQRRVNDYYMTKSNPAYHQPWFGYTTSTAANTYYYTNGVYFDKHPDPSPGQMVPPVPQPDPNDEFAWLRKRVSEITALAPSIR